MIRWLLILALLSCAPRRKPKDEPFIPWDQLFDKAELYKSHLGEHQDGNGFLLHNNCDSLLFSALINSVGYSVDLDASRDDTGRWFRRPTKDCYPGGSGSSISNDMFLGLYHALWANKDSTLVGDLIDYAKANSWNMGEGDKFRTILRPGMRATLADLDHKLTGRSHPILQAIPQIWEIPGQGKGLTGFTAHLQVLHILVRGEIHGAITELGLRRLEEHATRVPKNALFQYAYDRYRDNGDPHENVISLLLSEDLFPSDRLPNSSDRCTEWAWQRDPVDWEPCPEENITHTGADFLYIVGLLERRLSDGKAWNR